MIAHKGEGIILESTMIWIIVTHEFIPQTPGSLSSSSHPERVYFL